MRGPLVECLHYFLANLPYWLIQSKYMVSFLYLHQRYFGHSASGTFEICKYIFLKLIWGLSIKLVLQVKSQKIFQYLKMLYYSQCCLYSDTKIIVILHWNLLWIFVSFVMFKWLYMIPCNVQSPFPFRKHSVYWGWMVKSDNLTDFAMFQRGEGSTWF
jgi:hypothetical protein